MGACRKIIKLDPKSSVAYAGLARIYGLKGDVAKEIANYKASIKYNGKDYSSRLGLGKAYEKKGMYKEALKEYTSAHQLNPDSSEAIRKIPEMKIKILQQKYE
jgi:tetratricopeptide (TPR) repeat protein